MGKEDFFKQVSLKVLEEHIKNPHSMYNNRDPISFCCSIIRKIKALIHIEKFIDSNLRIISSGGLDLVKFTYHSTFEIEREYSFDTEGNEVPWTSEKAETIDPDQLYGTVHGYMLSDAFAGDRADENLSYELLRCFKLLIPSNLITDEEWESALSVTWKVKCLHDAKVSTELSEFPCFQEFATMVKNVAFHLNSVMEKDSVLVAVGNSPQLLVYGYQKIPLDDRNATTILCPIISGHPGELRGRKGVSHNYLTQEGVDNYTSYLKSIGFDPFLKNKTFYFLDVIESGIGINILIRDYLSPIVYDGNIEEAVAHCCVISIHNLDNYENSLGTKELCLGENSLSTKLDTVPESYRVFPNGSSILWHNPEEIDKFKEISMDPFTHCLTRLQNIFHAIESAMDDHMVS